MTADRHPPAGDNPFLVLPLPTLYLRNALPVIAIMMMNGLVTVVDAIFVGAYVGADALASITLMFPVFMVMVACASVVGSGSASLLARQLGAGHRAQARAAFTNSHLLALAIAALLMTAFAIGGRAVADWSANGHADIATMGWTYMAIVVAGAPLQFLLSLNGDALRSEGHAGSMAAVGALVTVANIAFTWWLVAGAGMGVAGSALGTVLAQLLAFGAVLLFRRRRDTVLRLVRPTREAWRAYTRPVLAIGVPAGLNFVGIALTAAVTIHALRLWQDDHYALTAAAYGVVTRIQAFAFLPLLGLGMATQAIVGNNVGAGLWDRARATLRVGLVIALVYGFVLELLLTLARRQVGALFVTDAAAIDEVARIVPIVYAMFFASGPAMIVAGFFQAIGDARRSAVIGLSRVYLFAVPLTYLLPLPLGETGIWLATPAASAATVSLAAIVFAAWRSQQAATAIGTPGGVTGPAA